MKTLIAVSSFIAITAGTQLSVCGSCCVAQTTSATKTSYALAKEDPKTVTLKITGMTCAGCSNHVATTLKQLDGVLEHKVEYPVDVAMVKYDAAKTSVNTIIKAIEKLGYKAEVIKEKKT